MTIDRSIAGNEVTGVGLKQYLERGVTEAVDVESRAYSPLPEIREEELSRWFCMEESDIQGNKESSGAAS